MARDIDGIIKQKYAESGDVGLGGLDLEELWPVSYSTPGGPFPQRIQFNQLFRYLSALGVELNSKGPFLEWDGTDPEGPDYEPGTVVTGSDDILYVCVIANGPSSTIVNPVGDTTGKWIEFIRKLIPEIDSFVSGNTIKMTLLPTILDFRDSSLDSGLVNTRIVPSEISVIAPSGATLGTINGVKNKIVIIAIDNAGTVELAIINVAGGVNLDETTLISTITIGAGSDSANVFYSTNARSNVPFRIVGYVESTQAAAGTWATAPSLVQGAGGQSIANLSGFSTGEWVSVVGSRSLSTTYYNTSGKPKGIVVSATSDAGSRLFATITQNGVAVTLQGGGTDAADRLSLIISVPPGASYLIDNVAGTPTLQSWVEI